MCTAVLHSAPQKQLRYITHVSSYTVPEITVEVFSSTNVTNTMMTNVAEAALDYLSVLKTSMMD